jgi:phosphoglucomutase
MDASSMASKIAANLVLEGSDEHKADAEKYILAICQGIVDEIQQNAKVLTVDSSGDTCTDGKVI